LWGRGGQEERTEKGSGEKKGKWGRGRDTRLAPEGIIYSKKYNAAKGLSSRRGRQGDVWGGKGKEQKLFGADEGGERLSRRSVHERKTAHQRENPPGEQWGPLGGRNEPRLKWGGIIEEEKLGRRSLKKLQHVHC